MVRKLLKKKNKHAFKMEKQKQEDESKKERFYIEPAKKRQIRESENIKKEPIEKLTERFEFRLTKTEKTILDNLKAKGFNVSEFLREKILQLEDEVVQKIKKEKYIELFKRLEEVQENLKKLYKQSEDYKSLRGTTQEEIQFLVRLRATIKMRISTFEEEEKQLRKNLIKYQEFSKKDFQFF